jgi:hypothetical protein
MNSGASSPSTVSNSDTPLNFIANQEKLMALSSGLTGKVTTLLTQAAELAIRGGTECISAELIDQAADNGIYMFAPQDSEAQCL